VLKHICESSYFMKWTNFCLGCPVPSWTLDRTLGTFRQGQRFMHSPVSRSNYSISVCDFVLRFVISQVELQYQCEWIFYFYCYESRIAQAFRKVNILLLSSYCNFFTWPASQKTWSYVDSVLTYSLWKNTFLNFRRNKQIGKPIFQRWVSCSCIYGIYQILSVWTIHVTKAHTRTLLKVFVIKESRLIISSELLLRGDVNIGHFLYWTKISYLCVKIFWCSSQCRKHKKLHQSLFL
jgi:hypothetical protein